MLIELMITSFLLAGGNCGPSAVSTGKCEVINDGSSVTVGGSTTRTGDSSDDRADRPRGETQPSAPPTRCVPTSTEICRDSYSVMLLGDEITIDDLVSFAPAASTATNEPSGLGVVRMPTNVIVSAGPHTATGVLLDTPVTVRFTPASFRIDYGDGTARETRTGGSAWSTLGVPAFTPTATSHEYAERGTYTVRSTVHYRAELDIGNGWFDVEGLLSIPAAPHDIRIVEVRTALVDETCLEDPTGPGC